MSQHSLSGNDLGWASMTRVNKDMKLANKGVQKLVRGRLYRFACKLVEARPGYKYLSKRARQQAKTSQCKKLARACAWC